MQWCLHTNAGAVKASGVDNLNKESNALVDWAVDWAVAEPTGLAMGERQVTVPDLVILTS